MLALRLVGYAFLELSLRSCRATGPFVAFSSHQRFAHAALHFQLLLALTVFAGLGSHLFSLTLPFRLPVCPVLGFFLTLATVLLPSART